MADQSRSRSVRYDGCGVLILESPLAGITPTARARMGIAHVPSDRGLFFGLTVTVHFRLDGVAAADLDGAFAHFPTLPAASYLGGSAA